MSKTKKDLPITKAVIDPSSFNGEVAPKDQNFEVAIEAGTIDDILKSGILDEIKDRPVEPLNICTTYFLFDQGKAERFVFLGIVNQETQAGEELPAIVLVDEDRNTYTNMGCVLVATFIERQIPIGTPVEITWTKTKPTKSGGNVRLWSVKKLSV